MTRSWLLRDSMSSQRALRDQIKYTSPLCLYSMKFALVFGLIALTSSSSIFLGGQSVQFNISWSTLLGKF